MPDLLQGLRVIIVEDEPMLQMALGDMLTSLGCSVAGRASRVAPARALVESAAFDIAVLDINLGGDRVDPVVDRLVERGTPFVFATGYGAEGVAPRLRGLPMIHKPFTTGELRNALRSAWENHIFPSRNYEQDREREEPR